MPIRKLTQDVASKIAAGEVVERPVSVIKELVENAIDAQATDISITVEAAGRKLIEVTDNGLGIAQDDLPLAAERYATSKISVAEDLEQIQSLGFRGEALASISAVSRFSIESRIKESEVGFAFKMEGGQVIGQREIGKPIGTHVLVRDLFFNVPARLKFLKSEGTERRQINRLVSRYALYYAGVRFSLFQDGKQVLLTSGNGERVEVLTELIGLDNAKKMLPVHYSDDYISISGYTSPYSLTRASRGDIFFFINGRLISDPVIASAITKGYHGLIMVGRFPISMLFITIEPQELDVNVHPTKTEVRLKNSPRVFSAVHLAIRKTISAYSPVPAFPQVMWSTETTDRPAASDAWISPAMRFPAMGTDPKSADFQPADNTAASDLPLLRSIGQLGLTYLAAEGPDGLYLIDQHAAHERVLYERLTLNETSEEVQLLLDPLVLSVAEVNQEEVEEKITIARGLGFKIEDFGPNSYKITGIPQILSQYDPETVLMSVITDDDEEKRDGLVDSEKREAVIRRICKRLAVKGGQHLSAQEQEQLIRDLENCQNPRTCPHGRPTIIHISVDALDRRFGRMGSV